MKVYPSYKDSGTVWQGEVPSHWEKLRNKNELYPKVHHVGSNPNKLPMLSLTKKGVIVRDLETGKGKFSADESKFLIVEPSDFVFCHYDIQETPRTVGLSTHLGYITGSYNIYGYKGKNRRFFYYLHEYFDDGKLLCPLYKGLRNTIRQDRFLSMRIFLPPVEEQNTIVAYLDKKCAEIDELVSRRQAIIERLKELKQSIIANAVTKGLNPDVPMKDSGIAWLGDVPKHWKILRLKNVASVITDTLSEKTNPDFEFDYVDISSVTQEQGIIKTERFKFANAPSRARRKVQAGDIIISTVRTYLRAIAVISKENENIIASTGFAVVRSKQFSYAAYVMSSHSFVSMVSTLSTGVSYPAITSNKLLRIHIAFPPEEEQQAIVAYLDKKCAEIDELVARQEKIIEKLKELKTSTIAHVVTGKVDVRDAI